MSGKVCAAVVSGLLLTSSADAGLTFRNVVKHEGSRDAKEMDMTTDVWMEGDTVKVRFAELGANPMFGKGSYLLMKGRDMFLVDPADRSYSRFDMQMFGDVTGSAGEMMRQTGFEVRIENPTFEKLLDEDGGLVAGYPTRHYRYRTTYTMTNKTPMGTVMQADHEIVEDVWTTTAISAPASLDFLSMFSPSAGALDPSLAALSAPDRGGDEGFALKRIETTRVKYRGKGTNVMNRMMKRGGDHDITTTTLVVDVRTAEVPASEFEIPAGFVERDLLRGGPTMPDLSGRFD